MRERWELRVLSWGFKWGSGPNHLDGAQMGLEMGSWVGFWVISRIWVLQSSISFLADFAARNNLDSFVLQNAERGIPRGFLLLPNVP